MSNLQSKRFIALNNEGVYMIKSGRYDEAIDCFISSVQLINHNLESIRDMPPPSAATPDLTAFSMIHGDHQVLYVPVNSSQSQYVFRNPIIVLWQDLSDKEMQSQDVGAHLFLVSLYNLALSYHLSALEKKCTKRLEQALSYYALSYKMLLNERDVVVSQAMVILNNIGHIHRLLNNEEGAKNCFQYLLTTMLFVQQSGESDRIQNWDSFLSNVMHLMVAGPQPAAAA
jgi:tetratricopeptide (TPR) repeat protein